jgi:PadR family transcriptional regulator AphA
MSLRYALLGLLSRESLTGYDLTKRFDNTIGNFWCAKHSQIYPELAALSEEGKLTFEVITQVSKPNKKIYTITQEGFEDLAHWVAEPPEQQNSKNPLLLKTWAIGQIEPEIILKHMRESLKSHKSGLAHLLEVDEVLRAQGTHLPERDNTKLGCYMALRCGLFKNQAFIDWLEWAIAQLEAVIAQDAVFPVAT